MAKMHVSLVILFMLFSACNSIICHKGHKSEFKGVYICNECDPGTFMPEDSHNKTECYPCTELKDASSEVLIRECNREEDALIACKPGFVRDENTCKECAVCEAGYEIQACNGDRNTVCCRSDISYIRVNSDGVKVCSPRTLPCKQGQFFVSGNICQPCQPGTYMVENHHNSTACSLCQQIPENQEIDDYVATVCNITRNNTSHGEPVLKKASDYSHQPGDMIATANVTDQAPSGEAVYVVSIILLCLHIFGLIVILCGLLLFKLKIKSCKCLLSLINYLSDKPHILDNWQVTFLIILTVDCIITLIQHLVHARETYVVEMMFGISLCISALIVIANLNMLVRQYRLQTAYQVCPTPSADNEANHYTDRRLE